MFHANTRIITFFFFVWFLHTHLQFFCQCFFQVAHSPQVSGQREITLIKSSLISNNHMYSIIIIILAAIIFIIIMIIVVGDVVITFIVVIITSILTQEKIPCSLVLKLKVSNIQVFTGHITRCIMCALLSMERCIRYFLQQDISSESNCNRDCRGQLSW